MATSGPSSVLARFSISLPTRLEDKDPAFKLCDDTGRVDIFLVLEVQANIAASFAVRNPDRSLPLTLLLLKP